MEKLEFYLQLQELYPDARIEDVKESTRYENGWRYHAEDGAMVRHNGIDQWDYTKGGIRGRGDTAVIAKEDCHD